MGKILQNYIEDEAKEYRENGLYFNPNSIYHGCILGRMDKAMLAKCRIAMLEDFIEFLFEHSEHCDHISQGDAWKEFDEYTIKSILLKEKDNG